ncbi:MAG: sugar phosphate isomerase/epimerase [Clostridiaceae bacterium]|jgi:sugar phosphate isomerase/epimerase|nr:sugar phosphate isomerase/epimerase [Clostridiaceae bacterium]
MILAAQLYTLRDYLKTPEGIKESLKKVRDIGYTSVQVSGIGPIESNELKKIVDDLGLTICATHIGYNRFKEDLNNVIKDHLIYGCKYVGLGSLPTEFRNEDGFRNFAKEFSEIGKELKKHGSQFVYHNHHFEFEKYNGKTAFDIILDESSKEDFGILLDTYWVQAGGADPVYWIHKLKGRMGVIHFKDMVIRNEKQEFAEVGHGNMNWGPIIEACYETGIEYVAIEQDTCLGDPFESLKMSYEFLKDKIK